MPINADLYLDRVDLRRHLESETCEACHVDSLDEFVDRLRTGRLCDGVCPHWPRHRVEAFRTAVDAGELLPVIPALEVPRPTEAGLLDLNSPTPDSPMLITGNSRLTHEVLIAVLSTTTAPFWILSVDTGGHTVDMSLVFGTLTPDAVTGALGTAVAAGDPFTGRIVLPGLADGMVPGVSEALGRPVEAGPVCAAELPLFFGSQWEQ